MVNEERDFTSWHQLCELGTVVRPWAERNKITQDLKCLNLSVPWITRFTSSKEGWGQIVSTSDTETEAPPQDWDLFIALRDHYTGTQG